MEKNVNIILQVVVLPTNKKLKNNLFFIDRKGFQGFKEGMWKIRSYEIQTLNELGLSVLQAKAYLALTHFSSANVKTISKFSNVARSDLYRTLSALQELGLVEKIIESPLEFRAIPLDNGLRLLLKNKTKKHMLLRSKTLQLIRVFKKGSKIMSSEEQNFKFVLIPKGDYFLERIRAAIAQSNRQIDLLLSWKRFSVGADDAVTESFDEALSRNVKFRLIVEALEETIDADRMAHLCKETSNCHFKFISHSPGYEFGIYDKKKAFVTVNPKADLGDSPALWSTNQSFVSLISDYFERLWFTISKNEESELSD